MIITIDTREKKPLFVRMTPAAWLKIKPGTQLDPAQIAERWRNRAIFWKARVVSGDYSLASDSGAEWLGVERKTIADLCSSVISNEYRELQKPVQYYVVEGSSHEVQLFDYSVYKSGKIGPGTVYSRLAWWMVRYKRHIVWAGNKQGAEREVIALLLAIADREGGR